MLSTQPTVPADQLKRETGWELKPEGLCRGEMCVPFEAPAERLDLEALAERLGAALVHDPDHGLWSLGPATAGGSKFLQSTRFPDLTLPDVDGNPFDFSSLLGRKVVMVAWASW